ncbi:MAG: lysophospholipase L1-like esterase [Planctomycetota bacterium]|jgi:lysophospholipase L1-like esterase
MTKTLRPVLLLLLALALWQPLSAQRYQREIQTWVAQDALQSPPKDALLFVGSSSILRWSSLQCSFAEYEVIQRGFGGSQFSDLNGYVDQIVLPYAPKAIVVFEGANDVASGKSAEEVFRDYLEFVRLVHSGQDQARASIPIFFIGITPTPSRWAMWSTSAEVNRMVRSHAAGHGALHYIDVPKLFLATGEPPSETKFVSDLLHLNPAGYELFSGAIYASVTAALPSERPYKPNPLHPAKTERILIDLGPGSAAQGGHSVGPDVRGNRWNNWHEVETGQWILPGEKMANLMTSKGAPSGIDLVIAGAFRARENAPMIDTTEVSLGNLDRSSATKDTFYCGAAGRAGGLTFHGLDPSLAYTLRLFGAEDSKGQEITRFTVNVGGLGGIEDLRTSAAIDGDDGGDGNRGSNRVAVYEHLHPDAYGQLFLEVRCLEGKYAYLGALELAVEENPFVYRIF